MKIRRAARANREFQEAADFLIERNPAAARAFAEAIDTAYRNLRDNPKLGRETDEPPTRQLVLSTFPYKIFYEIEGDTLVILSIFHTSRKPEHE